MKKFVFLCLASTGFAVLPPYYQSVRELEALIKNPTLCGFLSPSEVITEITRTERGYRVETLHYTIDVDIHYGGDQRIIGPTQFHFEFNEPVAKEQAF